MANLTAQDMAKLALGDIVSDMIEQTQSALSNGADCAYIVAPLPVGGSTAYVVVVTHPDQVEQIHKAMNSRYSVEHTVVDRTNRSPKN